jgi:type II secretory pathway component PulF
MATFRYTAKKGPTEVVEGVLEADNRNGVLSRLAELGYVPIRVSEEAEGQARAVQRREPPVARRRVSTATLTTFTRQFSSLVRSQVPLLRTMQILRDQTRHPYFRHVLLSVSEEVRQGQTLSSALAKFPDVFSPLYVSLVNSGEISGALDAVLERLAEQAERDDALRSKVRAAFTYPAFVAAVGAATVTFLMTFVMPRLSQLLGGLGQHLPLPTRLLLTVSAWMSSAWFWVGAGILAASAVLAWKAAGERGRLLRDRLILRLPVVGTLVQEVELARFARSFGLLLTQGISVLKAMEVAGPVVNHRVIRAELARIPDGLRQGEPLSACLSGLSVSTPFLTNTVAVGEESGRVGEALGEVAAFYERNAERAVQTMASLLEPTLIVVIGVVVGFIVMAVLLPIFEMSMVGR